ncbi:SWIM zinc finger family protein [Streptomyces sp. NPDC046831]|uniref:SWIM zinc finger family protein n=1 Tax=Streptomyces sp. NPDC046831 TaxID=3154805 RepID=UPI0033D5D4C2
MLADAFRMPSAGAGPGEGPSDTAAEPPRRPSRPVSEPVRGRQGFAGDETRAAVDHAHAPGGEAAAVPGETPAVTDGREAVGGEGPAVTGEGPAVVGEGRAALGGERGATLKSRPDSAPAGVGVRGRGAVPDETSVAGGESCPVFDAPHVMGGSRAARDEPRAVRDQPDAATDASRASYDSPADPPLMGALASAQSPRGASIAADQPPVHGSRPFGAADHPLMAGALPAAHGPRGASGAADQPPAHGPRPFGAADHPSMAGALPVAHGPRGASGAADQPPAHGPRPSGAADQPPAHGPHGASGAAGQPPADDPRPSSGEPRPSSGVPRLPRSMASPRRDGDLRRTFPPFPAWTPDRSGFAETWWGNAWVTALERGALDAARLARGRGYAEQGLVDAITVTPGSVLAYVQGSRPRPYRVQIRLRTLGDADWDRLLDAAAEQPGRIAALLDKEMPQSLADCGVPLLPGPGDLEPRCSCPDRGHPCKHAAALCYQTARLLDADPFVLLLLRGRGEQQLLDALARLSAARAARAAQDREPAPLPGVRASDVVARSGRAPLPAPLPPPPHPEQPPVFPAAPGGPDPFALDQLATDAAARAHALLTTGRDPVGDLTLWQDAVRLAAARPGSGLTAATRALYASLASAAGRTTADLARAVAAWRQGNLEGLAVLEEPWDPPAGRFDRARPLLLAAGLPAFRPWRNRLTHPAGHVQLRLGRDGLWYPYESEPGHDDWWPRGTPDLDPVGALTGLGAPAFL